MYIKYLTLIHFILIYVLPETVTIEINFIELKDDKICNETLIDFAKKASLFTQCSIENSRPISICMKCMDSYMEFEYSYKNISEIKVNETKCEDILLNKDRLQVVNSFHSNIYSIWERASCNMCYEWNQNEPIESNSTKEFYVYLNETRQCLMDNSKTTNDTDKICNECKFLYLNLNNFYETLNQPKGICMDIVDAMNMTREIWSGELDCCKLRKSPEVIFLTLLAIISTLPIIFYVTVRYCLPKRDLNVTKMNRFEQSLQEGNRNESTIRRRSLLRAFSRS